MRGRCTLNRDQGRLVRQRHFSGDLKPTAAGLAVKCKMVVDRGNSRWKGSDKAMYLSCSGRSQEAGVSGVESVRCEVMEEGITERLQSQLREGLRPLERA